jgi:hypothetical protein
MIMGSVSGWLMLQGMMARPRATSARTNSGVISSGMAGAEVLAGMLAAHELGQFLALGTGGAQGGQVFLAAQVLADGDVFHLRGDDALAGVVHLADIHAGFGPARLAVQAGEAKLGQFGDVGAAAAVFGGQAGQHLGVAPLLDPLLAQGGQALADVDLRRRVGVGAGAVVDVDGRVLLAPMPVGVSAWLISRMGTWMSGRLPST